MSKPTKASKRLATCIKNAISQEHNEFQWDIFFKSWFREQGSAYFFLFRKHLGVTNTQYIELLSLVENLAIDENTKNPVDELVFQTTENLKTTFIETVNSLLDNPKSRRSSYIDRFAQLYIDVFSGTAAVDMFYCSCAIFLPPGLTLNLEQLCARSGYVHSAGKSIYIRNIKKARNQDLEQAIKSYIDQNSTDDVPIPFVVYAHEDFSDFDGDAKDQITRGIDTTKLYFDKMSMGSYRLSQVVQDLRQSFKGRLEVPKPGSYKKEHKFQGSRAIWLIGERSISNANIKNPGGDRYYICYQQYAKNDSPFYLFDENKPAWKSHTTLPHSLTAALLNITFPQEESVICDPFGGTGTTWFEAKRISPKIRVLSSDLSQITPLLVKDNISFFLSNNQYLQDIHRRLSYVLDATKRGILPDEQPSLLTPKEQGIDEISDYLKSKSYLEELKQNQPKEEQEFIFSADFVRKLSSESYVCRLLFYTVLRAELRYQGSYKRKSITPSKAFEKSLDEILKQTSKFIEAREKVNQPSVNTKERFISYQGTYSPVLLPSLIFDTEKNLLQQLEQEIRTADARNLEPNTLDIILCDPPYGFNTSEESSELAVLYSEFLDSAILSLKNRGHLIIALPAESYTGRELPYCTKASLLINQILVKARKLNREMFFPATSVPHSSLRPPYYWEAERALRRTILHFRVAD